MRIIFFVLFLQLLLTPPSFSSLFIEERVLSPHFLTLLEICSLKHDGSLEDAIAIIQDAWLQRGKERWEFEERYTSFKEDITPELEALGVLSQVEAPLREFDHALLLGALLHRIRIRLAFLIQEWKRGVRFREILLLAGDRPLNPELENEESLLDAGNPDLPFAKEWRFSGRMPMNEAEMMQLVFEQAEMPKEMRELPCTLICAPKVHKNGKWVRPGRIETLLAWLDTSPGKGSCLAISNQPYVGYDDAIGKRFLPGGFSLYTAGPAADESTSIAIHLDNLARWLFIMDKRY